MPTRIITHDISGGDWVELNIWVDVISSNVAAIRYNINEKQLFVRFHHGGEYCYFNVYPQVALEMYQCPSMGKFVAWRLRKSYIYEKVS